MLETVKTLETKTYIKCLFVMRITTFAILSQVTRASQAETTYLTRFTKKRTISKLAFDVSLFDLRHLRQLRHKKPCQSTL